MKNKILFLLVLLFCQGCKPNIEFMNDKTPYYGNELRINGYYYNNDNEYYSDIIFFYRDGTVYQISQPKFDNENDRQKIDLNGISQKWGWGHFYIIGTNISYEYWGTSGCFEYVGQFRGTIDNDTTYTITRLRQQTYNNNFEKVSNIYKFRVFDNKPDSTFCKEYEY
jgi:hypothetical protein